MCELMWNSAQISKKKNAKKPLSFCQWGNGGDTSPTAALSPPSEGFGGVPPGTTFPKDQLPSSLRLLKQWQPLLTKHQQGYFDCGPARSKPESQTLLQCQRSRQTITVFIGRPTFEERSTNSLAVNSTTRR